MTFAKNILLLLIVGLAFSCSSKNQLSLIEGFAQGTTYHISFNLQNPSDLALIDAEIKKELARLDQEISNYHDDSRIEKLNAQITTEPIETSEEIINLIEIARTVSVASHGCYDVTIKPLFDLWGFKKDKFHLPSDEELQQTLALVGMNKLETLDKTHIRKTIANLRVDLSSIGQGYSVSRIAAILESHHITHYLVEIGGELKVRGTKPDGQPWRIAMEKPISTERKVEKIVIFASGEPMSLMPSGTYHHYFDENGKRYSHILDARTGKPIEHNTVVANAFLADPTLADAWSTALLCLGAEEGSRIADTNGVPSLFITDDQGQLSEYISNTLKTLKSVQFEAVTSP